MRRVRRGIAILLLILLGIFVGRRYLYPEASEVPAGDLTVAEEQETEEPVEEKEELVIDTTKEVVSLPERFDYREQGKNPAARDQGNYGTCWAFAALTALETTLLPEEAYDFSRDHLNFHNGYLLAPEEGGSYIMSTAYLTAWQGPVLEQDDRYGDNKTVDGLEPVKHVQEVRMPAYKDYEAIKQTVYLYGGVETSLYVDMDSAWEESEYYDRETFSYSYGGEEAPNHDVVIIGWDDDYPAENFKDTVLGNGAFICQNSWGERFGDSGIFYVSYYDVNVGSVNVAYTKVEEPDNYDVLYQSDLCGWSGQIGYNTDTACFANVYTAGGNQVLKSVGFYATGGESQYRIAVVPLFEGEKSLKDPAYVQAGYLQYAGFYTIPLEMPEEVKEGQKFAVIVQITTEGVTHPIAVEFASKELEEAVSLEDGEGYISPDGKNWQRVEEAQESNLCLKVYADWAAGYREAREQENTEEEAEE